MKPRKKYLFTPGPVAIPKHILALGSEQPPYNRTPEFSDFTKEILEGLQYVFQTQGSVALLTASGTAAMEAAVLNLLDSSDKALVINGGTFGKRWCDLCTVHSIAFEEIELAPGCDLDLLQLKKTLSAGDFTALLINAHETSTGHLYDIESIGKIAKQYNLLFIVDAISTIGADPFFMDKWSVDVAILSSQKALALPPGLAFVALAQRALDRLAERKPKTLYLNLQNYLENQTRGQLPYTPAIGLLVQLHQRLYDIRSVGLENMCIDHENRAFAFREAVKNLPFRALPDRLSNALTALVCETIKAFELVGELREEYGIEAAPSGGGLKDTLFRVSHMGDQDEAEIKELIVGLENIVHSSKRTQQERIN
ncbi:MAG: alanine--glyoxylate aminotransferase family protein [Opitutaceae bacterium]|nr:alanine--glyoxylate aminotransferase family protein [Opitutaceae bacterium]